MELCRYFGMPGGCVRGEKCFFAHGEDVLGRAKIATLGSKTCPNANLSTTTRPAKRMTEDTSKKVFVGGLPPCVESEGLRDFFEVKFGPVMDAIVIASHSGDHVQSRGFGFVTFKDESSVTAAVQAHYITIIGKKVEIKSAVARSVLPTLDSGSAGSELATQVEDTKLVDMSVAPLPCDSTEKSQTQWIKTASGQQSHGNGCVSVRCSGTEDLQAFEPPTLRIQGSPPAWVTKFKQWLPRFLKEVSSRLKEGEWYPLSSLKGDFRATCGLELDHVGLGYNKLSDFIRSLSEICKMKIVPVGRGPATHMVLLPLPTSNSAATLVCGSLVGPGRSYAAAAHVKNDSGLQVAPLAVNRYQTFSVGPTMTETRRDALPRPSTASTNICKYRTSFQEPTRGKAVSHQEEDSACLAELLSLLSHTDKEVSPKLYHAEDANRSDMISSSTKLPSGQAFPSIVHVEGRAEPRHGFASVRGTEKGNSRALLKISSRERSSSPLSGESSMYSMWGHKLRCNTYNKDSPQSVLSSAFRAYSPHRSQLASPCPASPTESEMEYPKEMCPVCHQRKALWVAVPCSHRAVCTGCKDSLKLSQNTDTKCYICSGLVDRWIALH